jgi:threonine synthase
MVNSFRKNLPEAETVANPQTQVITIATGSPGPAYSYLYNVVDEHGGTFEDVSDEETYRALHVLAKMEGLSMESAAAAAFAGLFKLLSSGVIKKDETIVVNCSGHTFPVEKFLLEDDWVKVVPSVLATPTPIPASTPPPPPRSPSRKPTSEDLLGALDKLDARVKHIAIIEDNPDAARLLRRILQTRGDYQIKEAHSGKEGLELIRTLHPDLIMLDLMMPDMDGFSVLDNLKADPELENIPVIVITAKELNTEERKRLQGQIQMLMQKGSFMQEDLVAGIHALLGEEEEQI